MYVEQEGSEEKIISSCIMGNVGVIEGTVLLPYPLLCFQSLSVISQPLLCGSNLKFTLQYKRLAT